MSKKKRRGRGKAPQKTTAEDQDASLEAQVAKLKINNSSAAQNRSNNFDEVAFLDEAIKLAAAENDAQWINGCDHGRPIDARVLDFVRAFESAFDVAAERTGNFSGSLDNAATIISRKYNDVWFDSARINAVVSSLLCKATEDVLRGGEFAGYFAALVYYFEHHIAVGMDNKAALETFNTQEAFELHRVADCNDRVLISFLRKRIPCKCLDEKYEEVKSMPKMGICANLECPLPDRKAERSKMFYCARCRERYYCSLECQTADWPEHKQRCYPCPCCNSCGNKIR